jgi:hypothetical protein
MLGHLSVLIKSNENVHFRVIERLESDHTLESRSALYCATQLCALSVSFANAMLRQVPTILKSLQKRDNFKLGLIEVLSHMKHSSAISQSARTEIIQFLETNPKEDFVVSSLRSLSSISRSAHVFLAEQVALLLHYLGADPRPRVRLASVRGLFGLAAECPYSADYQPQLILAILAKEKHPSLQTGLLALIAMLAKRWRVSKQIYDTKSIVPFLNSSDQRMSVWALRALREAAGAFSESATQLFTHLKKTLSKGEPHRLETQRSELFSSCLALCSEKVALRSPEMGGKMVQCLLDACGGTKLSMEQKFVRLHCLSLAVGRIREMNIDVAQFLTKMAALGMALAGELTTSGSSQCFAAAAITYLRAKERSSRESEGDFGELSLPIKQVLVYAGQSGEWRWAVYSIAKEAMRRGLHAPVMSICGRLAQLPPASSRSRSWLLFLEEMARAESTLDMGAAAVIWRKANVLLAGACPPAIRLKEAAVVRESRLLFQKMFVKWMMGVMEAPVQRKELWRQLAQEAHRLQSAFPDMDGVSIRYLEGCKACCNWIGGEDVSGVSDKEELLVEKLWGAIVAHGAQIAAKDVVAALVEACSAVPPYFFRTKPSITIDLSVVQSTSEDLGNMSNHNEVGRVITIDGVVRSKSRLLAPKFSVVDLEVSVVWTAEKISVVGRQLASDCGKLGRGVVVLSTQRYRSPVFNDSFSVVTVNTFPKQPKEGHLLKIRVAFEDESGFRWENCAVETHVYNSLMTTIPQ